MNQRIYNGFKATALVALAMLATPQQCLGAQPMIDPALLRISPHPAPAGGAASSRGPAWRPAIEADTFDLAQAVQLAVDWHPSIAQAVASLYQQGEAINAAEAGYRPQISGGLKAGVDSGYSGERGSQAISLSLKQMLYDFGKVRSAVDAARAKAAQAQAQLLLSVDQVARDTAVAYIERQRYQALLALAEAQLQALERVAELARQRSDMGASTRSDLAQAQSRVAGGLATVQEYRAAYARWQATLSNLVGRATLPDGSDHYPATLNDACRDSETASDLVPSVLAALAQRDQAQAELAQARAQAYPTLSLEPTLNHYLDNDYNEHNPYLDRTQVGVYLNMEVPLYQGGATSARSRGAAHALSAADAAEDAARLQARQGLAEARTQTLSLSNRLATLDQRQASIRQARELYGQQYLELGSRPLLDLLNAEQELYQARFDASNTAADLRKLELECLYSSGGMRRAFALDGRDLQGVEVLP